MIYMIYMIYMIGLEKTAKKQTMKTTAVQSGKKSSQRYRTVWNEASHVFVFLCDLVPSHNDQKEKAQNGIDADFNMPHPGILCVCFHRLPERTINSHTRQKREETGK